MDKHVKDVVIECTKASHEERITFPEVVKALMEAGVERYHADLLRGENTFYMPGGESERVMGHAIKSEPAKAFSAVGVDAAVRTIQRQEIRYGEFCARIAAAGCVGYIVSMAGRRAVYYGRTGETHVEMFPGAQ
ncbi:MAG: DUF1398 family protein [Rhizomicrobium sp.]